MPAKGQRTGYLINCDNCGKEVYQTKTQYNRSKHHYCSSKCQFEFQHKQTYEDRKCEMCDKKFHVRKKSPQRFCSIECQKKWQKTNIGIKNPKFEGKILSCDWCGKTFERGKDKINRYKHHFCSTDCKKNWYTNVYSQSEEWKEESRIRAVKLLESSTITQTKPQLLINELLDALGIVYENEKNCKYYSIDNYLVDSELMIEVMGDFWHCSPLKFESIKKDIHKKVVPRDKAKHTYIKKYYNVEILYLWENDIYFRMDVCEKLILEYINNNGLLANYNSFNYEVVEGKLKLKENIIISHQEMSVA